MTYETLTSYEPSAALAFGTAGLVAQLMWPMFKARESMLTVQLVASCCYAASYALIEQTTAAAVCILAGIQITIALLAGDRPWLRSMGYVALPMVLAIGVATYSGLPTIFAVMASTMNILGRLQVDTLRMRCIQLGASPFGAAHDVATAAWPNLAGAILSFAIAVAAIRREFRHRRQTL